MTVDLNKEAQKFVTENPKRKAQAVMYALSQMEEPTSVADHNFGNPAQAGSLVMEWDERERAKKAGLPPYTLRVTVETIPA